MNSLQPYCKTELRLLTEKINSYLTAVDKTICSKYYYESFFQTTFLVDHSVYKVSSCALTQRDPVLKRGGMNENYNVDL